MLGTHADRALKADMLPGSPKTHLLGITHAHTPIHTHRHLSGENPRCHTRAIPDWESNPGGWPPRREGAPLRRRRVGTVKCELRRKLADCFRHLMAAQKKKPAFVGLVLGWPVRKTQVVVRR